MHVKSNLIAGTVLLLSPVLHAQSPRVQATRTVPISHVRYDVTFDSTTASTRTINVAMSFSVASPGSVLLSLPSWTPGQYEISNYARFVSDFGAFSGSDSLVWDKFDPDTWRCLLYTSDAADE